ncbi:MAG: hypothetical protein K8R40_10735 [Anaerolineaceae bacterium]|nr:hypothetical protein [Anaerolineaceae bacterium]
MLFLPLEVDLPSTTRSGTGRGVEESENRYGDSLDLVTSPTVPLGASID